MNGEGLLTGPIEAPAHGPARPISLTQTRRPASVRRHLVSQAARDGWIVVAVNFNAAIFLGLVPLTAGYGATGSLYLLGVQSVANILAAGILLSLTFDAERTRIRGVSTRRAAFRLSVGEVAMMAGWGGPATVFLGEGGFEGKMLVVMMLTVIGSISAALSSRLPGALILGRLALFAPALLWFAVDRPEGWALLSALTVFAACVTMAVGFATYVQHLAQATQAVRLAETRDALRIAVGQAERNHEAAMREAAMRERFMHSVTHDLRQPIGALGFYLDDIGRRAPDAAAALGAARSCVVSANGIIDSVAQLALVADGLPPPNLAPTPLTPLFARLVEEAQALAAHHGLSLRYAKTSLAVVADADRLERIVRNLIHNAIQNTSDGGVLIGARRRDRDVAVEVWDTGPGVPPEDRERIFQAFRQGRARKSRTLGSIGLGLGVVSDFAASMNGRVELRSEVGSGSCFSVILPRPLDASPVVAPSGRLAGRRLLIVDDDEAYAARTADAFRREGAEAQVLCDATEIAALDATGVAEAEALVLDVDLGPGLDGIELRQALGADAPPTLLVSANVTPALAARAKEASLPVMRKQATDAALIVAVASLLHRAS